MGSREDCFVCGCVSEVAAGEITVAMAVLRGLSLGVAVDAAELDDPDRARLLHLLCLRHCDAYQRHDAYVRDHVGMMPGTWGSEPWTE